MKVAFWMGVLVLLVAFAYRPLTHAGFVYEDARWMQLEAPGLALRDRPLMAWSWWAQSRWTPSPSAFHGVNVGLHLLVAVLFGVLLWRLGLSRIAAVFGAALLALHPLASEPVAYLSARPELFAAIGILGACALALTRWRWWTALSVLVAVLFGLAGKETALVALMLVPFLLWRTGHQRARWAGLGSAVLLLAGVTLQGGWLSIINRGDMTIEQAGLMVSTTAAWFPWLALQATAAMRLLGQAVFSLLPATSALTVDYDYDLLAGWVRLGSVLALIAMGILAYRQRHTRPLVTIGLGWFLLALLPRLIVQTPRGYLNEHQFLVPFMGLLITFVAIWDKWACPEHYSHQ